MEEEYRLIQDCISGKRDAQKLLFQRYFSSMLSVLKRYASNEEEARDLVMEGFMKVFDNLPSFRQESSLKTWISRIMVNHALNQIRKNKKMMFERIDDLGEELHPEELEEEATDSLEQLEPEKVLKLMNQLPEGYRTILNLFAVEGFSHKQISSMLGISEGTSKSQVAKARTYLKKLVLNLNSHVLTH
ncbi:MAG: sigma-70 family RNA polymerase sigma factor [Bacteroidia bacterium]|nr:sigma-70 family RNA polymerase sigma factor [Bacteroidia bacterium]